MGAFGMSEGIALHGSVLGFFAYGALTSAEVKGKDVLEVGSLDVNGSVRPMVMARGPASYVGVDIVPGSGVDLVADAEELWKHVERDSFDVVISTEMLEHADHWRRCIGSMVTALRPGGVLVITTRSPGYAYHHPPDHWRYTLEAFAEIIARLDLEPFVIMNDPDPGSPGVFVKARKPTDWTWPAGEKLEDIDGVTPVTLPLKILGLPVQPDGTGYYRFWQPFTQLANRSGHLVVIPPAGRQGLIPADHEIAEFDIVARQRPGGIACLREWRRWKGTARLVYETDDDVLHADPSALPHLLDGEWLETARACLELADMVTVSTEPLAEVLRRHNDNVVVLGNQIHADILKIKRPQRERVTLCWAGGVSHLQDLMLVQNPLREVLAGQDVDLHMIGTDYRPILGGRGRFTPWQLDVWDYYKAIDGDIGVIPLADTPFNRARSYIKALEYAALGIPVVASDVEPYRDFVVDGVTGYLANSPTEWRRRLIDLINDPAARTEMGAKAREVAAGYTIQQGWTRWRDAYEEVARD